MVKYNMRITYFIYFKMTNLSYFMSMCECPHVCLYTMCIPGAHRCQKTALHVTELELGQLPASMWVLGTKPRSSFSALSFSPSLSPSLGFPVCITCECTLKMSEVTKATKKGGSRSLVRVWLVQYTSFWPQDRQ